MSISLEKRPLVDLQKDAGRAIRNLNLGGQEADVIVVLDRSGSMQDLYQNGTVQCALERCLALASHFDPDKRVDVYAFHNAAFELGDMTMTNYGSYVDDKMRHLSWGGTEYAPTMALIAKKYGAKSGGMLGFGAKKPTRPTFVLFFTDGDNDPSDKAPCGAILREASDRAIFWKFVGVGSTSFAFLQKLDDLKGRKVDNADFFRFDGKMDDDALFGALLNEFSDYLTAARGAGILA